MITLMPTAPVTSKWQNKNGNLSRPHNFWPSMGQWPMICNYIDWFKGWLKLMLGEAISKVQSNLSKCNLFKWKTWIPTKEGSKKCGNRSLLALAITTKKASLGHKSLQFPQVASNLFCLENISWIDNKSITYIRRACSGINFFASKT